MRILHTADTHIGARQYGLDERRADFADAFRQVVAIAREADVAAVVHAGDLFDDNRPSAEDLNETLAALSALREAGIPFLGIVGNHERRRGVQWLDLFARLGLARHLGEEPVEVEGWRFVGLDYAGRRDVALPDAPADVLVAHQLIDRVFAQAELTLEAIGAHEASYALLGDWHEHEVWREADTLVTYSGSTERWSLDEAGRRGVSLIDVATGRLDRRLLSTRPFLYIRDDEDPLRAIEAKRSQLEGAVVCVAVGPDAPSAREIDERARDQGALAVRIRDRRPEADSADADDPDVAVSLDMGNVDALLEEQLATMELSEPAREIDRIIRDLTLADSNVDNEVSKLLDTLTKTDGRSSEDEA